jgi:5-methylcytosine-specific restriction endonuclease McrA
MGLGDLLINYANKNKEKIPLRELSEDFLDIYQERVDSGKHQKKRTWVKGEEKGLTVIETELKKIKLGETTREKAISIVQKDSLENMVLKKFHGVFHRQIPDPFYQVTKTHLILQKNTLDTFTDNQNKPLNRELDSRWKLLEFGFENTKEEESLEVDFKSELVIKKNKRTPIAQLRPILNGYQRGNCFYCGLELDDSIEVDHVIPWTAINHDDIWNLVLAHVDCNRQKLAHLPPKPFVEKLIQRNEIVLHSDLPLKEELKKVLGNSAKKRMEQVWTQYKIAVDTGLTIWGGNDKFDPSNDDFYKSWIGNRNASFWERKFDKIQ